MCMVLPATVVLEFPTNTPRIVELIRSLDAQDLPYAAWDAVLLLDELDEDSARRLKELENLRPNFTVGRVSDFDWGRHPWRDVVIRIAEEAVGDGLVLEASAIRSLCDGLVTSGAPAIIGRLTWSQETASAGSLARGDQRFEGVVPAVVAVTRDLLLSHSGSVAQALAAAPRIAMHAERSIGTVRTAQHSAARPPADQVTASCWWEGSVLRLEAVATTQRPSSAASLWVRRLSDQLELLLETETAATADGYRLSGALNISELGGSGLWQLGLALEIDGALVRQPLPPMSSTGLIDGLPVVVGSLEGAALIDVGALRLPSIGDLDPSDVSITESAAGTVLHLALPSVHVAGVAETKAMLVQGGFKLLARLVSDGSSAAVVAHASGLSGTEKLSVQLGSSPPASTGLDLHITPGGDMFVSRTGDKTDPQPRPCVPSPVRRPAAGLGLSGVLPPKPESAPQPQAATRPVDTDRLVPKPAATKASATGAPAGLRQKPPQPGPSSAIQRLRRRVPGPLEPVARKLSRIGIAKKVYRALNR